MLASRAAAAAEAIAGQPRGRAADHHADEAERDDRREGAARDMPVRHDRRDGDAQQLVVDAVEDDRQRGERRPASAGSRSSCPRRSSRPASTASPGLLNRATGRASARSMNARFSGLPATGIGVRLLVQLHRQPAALVGGRRPGRQALAVRDRRPWRS